MTAMPARQRVVTALAFLHRTAGYPPVSFNAELATIEAEAIAANRAALAPFLRHRATCYLQAVRDNAPDDPTCTCGLRELFGGNP